MNLEERNTLIQRVFETQCLPILQTKGADYMVNDAWDQFLDLAKLLNLTPEQVMFVYLDKHLKALRQAMQSGSDLLKGEGVNEKLKDIANYALLMLAFRTWIVEQMDEDFEKEMKRYHVSAPKYAVQSS